MWGPGFQRTKQLGNNVAGTVFLIIDVIHRFFNNKRVQCQDTLIEEVN